MEVATLLTQKQKDFLKKYNISESLIFDAKWLQPRDYWRQMEILDKMIAINTKTCKKGWHNMKTRSWHCIECEPRKLSFIKRRYKEWYVYVSASNTWKLLKIGLTDNTEKREKKLNDNFYANLNDWKIIYYIHLKENAGEFEHKIQKELYKYRHKKEYNYYWKNMISYEIFSCGYSIVKNIFDRIKKEIWINKINWEFEKENAVFLYNYPNIENNWKTYRR